MYYHINKELIKILWEENYYSRIQAWFDLLENSSTIITTIQFHGSIYKIAPNQQVTSDKTLCYRWGWSRSKVRDFISTLEELNFIKTDRDKKKTIITIYNSYTSPTLETSENPKEATTKQQEFDHQKIQAITHPNNMNECNLSTNDIQEEVHDQLHIQATKSENNSLKLAESNKKNNLIIPFNYD